MKKQQTEKTKLVVKRQTIRAISNQDLAKAAGGQYTYDANATCGFCHIIWA